MEIKFVIEKKHVYFLSLLIILFGGVIFVKGFGGGDPPTMGHTLNELEMSDGTNFEDYMNSDVCSLSNPQNCPSFAANCEVVNSGWSTWNYPDITADCPGSKTLIGGSCSWDDTDYIWSNALGYQDGNSWRCKSKDGSRRAEAHAFCC